MKLSLGIVGLPNVGKSTLFNALTNNNVPAENYPFNTIDPNVGVVPVMDNRLQQIADLIKPQKFAPAVIEFWDIAGLVKGAAQGEGLGNQFLANIRNVAAIVHVVRGFKNDNVHHVEASIDPARDIDLINTELILKDLETIGPKVKLVEGKAKSDPKQKPIYEWAKGLQQHLESGKLANQYPTPNQDPAILELRSTLFLLTDKPVIFLVNTTKAEEAQAVAIVKGIVGDSASILPMDIKLERELSELSAEDRQVFMDELDMSEPGIALLTRACYDLLGLISYFTAGEKEVKAWTIVKGSKAPEAAGEIHTDFIKKFIAADVVNWQDFITCGGWVGAKAQGKVKLQGKEYIMQDGDLVEFRIGA